MKLQTRLRLWWHRLFIRNDELHPSLNADIPAMEEMTREERGRYRMDLCHRRWIAHERDLECEDNLPPTDLAKGK